MLALLTTSATAYSCDSIKQLYNGNGFPDRTLSCCDASEELIASELTTSVNTFCEPTNPSKDGYESLVASFYRRFYVANAITKHDDGLGTSLGFALNSAADVSTVSWSNYGGRELGNEPRIAFDNTPGSSLFVTGHNVHQFSLYTWESLYGIMKDAKKVMQFHNKSALHPRLVATTKFAQALTIGYLANIFDKVVILTEESDSSLDSWDDYVDHKTAMQTAISKLDEAIAICDLDAEKQYPFTVGTTYTSVKMTSSQYASLMRSYGARMLAGNARSRAENLNADWEKVESYASQGIETDFVVKQDFDYSSWMNGFVTYITYPGWARIDLKVINLMDPTYPTTWPASTTTLPPANSQDSRLESDFKYLPSNDFPASRGEYHFSSYRYKASDEKFLYKYGTVGVGELPEVKVAEVQMYLAEAKLRRGHVEEAAAIVNHDNGSRVGRGNLSPVAVDEAAIDKAIHYERLVEFPVMTPYISFFEMRRTDSLQFGTPLHIPVPGAVLESLNVPHYTYGGTGVGDYGDLTGPHGVSGVDYAAAPPS